MCPEAGTEFWRYVADEVIEKDKEISGYRHGDNSNNFKAMRIQNLVIKAVKEAHDSSDQQAEQIDFCLPDVVRNDHTSDEDTSLLCNMMQNNTGYIKSLVVDQTYNHDLHLSSSQYHCICRSVSCASDIQLLSLCNISGSADSSSDCLPVLELQTHDGLEILRLEWLSIGDLLLPSGSLSTPISKTKEPGIIT